MVAAGYTKSTLAELKAIPPQERVAQMVYAVRDPMGDGSMGPSFYMLMAGTTILAEPEIAVPDTGTGFWKNMGSTDLTGATVTIGPDVPSSPSAAIGDQYHQISSTKTVVWTATGTSSSADWRAVAATPVRYSGNPTNNITPDFEGQFCWDTLNNGLYYADGGFSYDWVFCGGTAAPGGGS